MKNAVDFFMWIILGGFVALGGAIKDAWDSYHHRGRVDEIKKLYNKR